MKLPIDLHVMTIAMMCAIVLLLLRSIMPPALGGSILAMVPQLPVLTRAVSRKGGSRAKYVVVNELVVALSVGVYLMIRLL